MMGVVNAGFIGLVYKRIGMLNRMRSRRLLKYTSFTLSC